MRHLCRVWAFTAAILLTSHGLVASEPRAGAGNWERAGANHWLLRDPLTSQPVALLDNPLGWFSPEEGGVIEGLLEASATGLDVVTVQDVAPEFWAQPSVWNMFQRGPSAFSGFGRDTGPREWAGRPGFDRRAYDLDPGWESDIFAPSPASGPGKIQIQVNARTVTLRWHGLPGRVYVIQFTTSLNQPLQGVQTVGSLVEGDLSVELPMGSPHGFFRIAEQVY